MSNGLLYAQIQVKATTDWGVTSATACGHKPLKNISQVVSEEESYRNILKWYSLCQVTKTSRKRHKNSQGLDTAKYPSLTAAWNEMAELNFSDAA